MNDLATCRVFIEILAPIPEFRQPAVRRVNTTAKSYAREMEGSVYYTRIRIRTRVCGRARSYPDAWKRACMVMHRQVDLCSVNDERVPY